MYLGRYELFVVIDGRRPCRATWASPATSGRRCLGGAHAEREEGRDGRRFLWSSTAKSTGEIFEDHQRSTNEKVWREECTELYCLSCCSLNHMQSFLSGRTQGLPIFGQQKIFQCSALDFALVKETRGRLKSDEGGFESRLTA